MGETLISRGSMFDDGHLFHFFVRLRPEPDKQINEGLVRDIIEREKPAFRMPTSDWMKNDPVLQRWAQEEAAANSSDTPSVAPATDAAQPTAHYNKTVNPKLENLQVNSQTGVSPLLDGEPTEKEPRFQPILYRLPTSDWMKNDPVLQRWAQEEAAANSSKTPEIPRSIQAKLTVSTPGDKYEQEADAMAAKVMAMPDTAIEPQQIASKQSNSTTAALQRAGQEDKTLKYSPTVADGDS